MALTYDQLLQPGSGLNMDMPARLGHEGNNFRKDSVAVAKLVEFQLQETQSYFFEIIIPDMWRKAMTPMAHTDMAYSWT